LPFQLPPRLVQLVGINHSSLGFMLITDTACLAIMVSSSEAIP
jgi:hypothetical protein